MNNKEELHTLRHKAITAAQQIGQKSLDFKLKAHQAKTKTKKDYFLKKLQKNNNKLAQQLLKVQRIDEILQAAIS